MKTKLFKGIAIVGFLSLALVGCDKSTKRHCKNSMKMQMPRLR